MLEQNLVTVGKISAVFGIKGWLKVYSYTDPIENLLSYDRFWLEKDGQLQTVNIDAAKRHGDGLIIHIESVDDRDKAKEYTRWQIKIAIEQMPSLGDGEYYWHQLQGLSVYLHNKQGKPPILLGKIDYLLETGANDVLVIKSNHKSAVNSAQEILIPYLPGDVVMSTDIEAGTMLVDWQIDE
tara:strand:+ start:258 stop:803 length:546 start_codon:yes stop_codon:yes gene_type:complete